MSLALNKLNYSPKRLRIRTHPPQASLRVSPHECLGHCACFVKKIKENLNGCYRPCRSIKPTGPVTAWPHHRGAASEFDHTSPQDRADQACAGEWSTDSPEQEPTGRTRGVSYPSTASTLLSSCRLRTSHSEPPPVFALRLRLGAGCNDCCAWDKPNTRLGAHSDNGPYLMAVWEAVSHLCVQPIRYAVKPLSLEGRLGGLSAFHKQLTSLTDVHQLQFGGEASILIRRSTWLNQHLPGFLATANGQ